MPLDSVPLAATGTSVSDIALGTWRFGREDDAGEMEIDRDRAHDLLDCYAAHGGRFIDTANVYGDGRSEEWIGDWLATQDREEYVLASKIYFPTREDDPNGGGLGRKHVRRQIDLMLDRLGISTLDLLYIHRWDDDTAAEELMRTLDGLVRDGKVHYLGASTLEPDAWRIARANEIADRRGYEPFTVSQPRFNVVNREIEGNYLEMCETYDIGVCPWSPLAGGFLTGKYTRSEEPPEDSRGASDEQFREAYLREEHFDALEVVEDIAAELDATPSQVSLAWLLHHPAVVAPLVGARTVDQLEENIAATELELTEGQFERLATAL